MLKPIAVNAEQFNSAQPQPDESIVNNVFKVFHGFYGNLFLGKFASGVTDSAGRDKGVASARTVWAFSLRKFSEQTVVSALDRCQTLHAEFPPSLPQFLAVCAACAPRRVYQPTNAIGMSNELRSQYARQARAINAKHEARAVRRKTGFVALPSTLDGLKQAIASAAGEAGGNEAAELLRLDRMFVRTAA
jgi:hypothetical protein